MENTDFRRLAAYLAMNFGLSLLICAFFLLFTGGHPVETAYACAALVSNTAMLYAALALPAALLWLAAPGRALLGAVMAVFQLWLITDVSVYKIFKLHFNSMVINILVTPGGLESLDQGWGTKALFLLAAALTAGAQWYFWRRSAAAADFMHWRRLKYAAAFLLLCAAADKGLFAWGTLYDYPYVTRNAQLFPLYQPLRIRTFASKYLGVKLDKEVRGGIDVRYTGLAYPAAPLRTEPPARPLNFLIIVVDSLRADMLSPEVMPNTSALGRSAAVFYNHRSGGNCTRFGIFSIMYGLYGNYWFPMLGEQRGPLLIDTLRRQGYDLRLYASAKLSFPEFNKTCFVNVPRSGIYDEPEGDGAQRDREISERFIEYLKTRDAKKPYFAFVFYDASHGSYDYAPGYEKFKPSVGVSQLEVSKANIGGLFNKYRNSVGYDDHLAGEILKAVGGTGGLKDTVIIITGDHGEAFLERGRYGHNQGYSPEEIRVPLVFYRPGLAPRRVDGLTSHLDIVPTLLPLLGVKNRPSEYSAGRGLFDASPRDFVPVASWDTAAIARADGWTLEMPLEAYKGGVKAFDPQYRETKGAAGGFTPLIMKFQKEAARFSR